MYYELVAKTPQKQKFKVKITPFMSLLSNFFR